MTAERTARRAHRVALTASLLTIFVTLVTLVSWRALPAYPIRYWQYAALFTAGLALGLLWLRRRSPSRRWSLAAFVAVLVPVWGYYWLNDSLRAAQGVCWVAFEGNKVALFAIALLAPPSVPIGVLAMSSFVASALLHFALMPHPVVASMAAGEPWTTLAYAGVAGGIFVYRLHSSALEDEIRKAHSEAALMQEVAVMSLALRDLANSPLQTLEILHRMMLNPAADRAAIERRMRRALDRLRELNLLLCKYEAAAGGRASLDSLSLLRRQVGEQPSP